MKPASRLWPAALALAAWAACSASAQAHENHGPAAKKAAVPTLPAVTVHGAGFGTQRAMRPGALREEIVMTESVSARAIERSEEHTSELQSR